MSEPTTTPEHLDASKYPQPPLGRLPTRAERINAAMGKFAWIPFSSDDYVREKRNELDREERKQEERQR